MLFGTLTLVSCTILLALSDAIKGPSTKNHKWTNQGLGWWEKHTENKKPLIETWVPVVFGILTPNFYCMNTLLLKHLTGLAPNQKTAFEFERKRFFNEANLTFSSIMVVNIFVMAFAIPYWTLTGDFDLYLFWVGFVASSINAIGLYCCQMALARGPAGPITAIIQIDNLLLVIIEAIKNKKLISGIESVALVLGVIGALILTIPDEILRLVQCDCDKHVN